MKTNRTDYQPVRPLIRTRLEPPAMTHVPLRRTRLYQRLNEGIKHPLTTVVSPAGYGKTALLTLWAKQSTIPVGWFRVDEYDQELCSFMAYFVHALPVPEAVKQQCVESLWASKEIDQPSRLVQVVSELVDQLQRMTEEMCVIIDGYERVSNQEIHDALSCLLACAPPHVHLIVASRTEIPVVHGRVKDWDYVQIDSHELSMTLPEIAAYYTANSGLQVRELELQDMEEQSQGWVTGMNSIISVVRRTGAYQLGDVSFYAQIDSRLAGFFQAQVMGDVSVVDRERLMRISVPEIIDESLFAVLCDQPEQSLSGFVDNGLFLFKSTATGEACRLHPLFRRYLQKELKQSRPKAYFSINRTCMHWFEDHGLYVEAAKCAQQIGDEQSLAAIITSHPDELLRDEHLPLLHLLDQFSEASWNDYPVLAWLYAAALVHARKYVKAERMLDVADLAIAEAGNVLLPTTGEDLRAYIFSERSRIHMSRNEPEIGLQYTIKTAELLGGPGKLHDMLSFHPFTTSLLNSRYGFWGALPSARLVIDFCEPRWNRLDAGYCVILIMSGECRYEAGELEEAQNQLNRGLQLGLELNEPGLVIPAFITLARIAWCKKDCESAYVALQEGRDHLFRMNRRERIRLLDACEIDFRIRESQMKPVRRWIAGHPVAVDSPIDPYRMFESIVLLRGLFALGRTTQARMYGQRLLRSAESNGFSYHIVEIRLLLAQSDRLQGNADLSAEKLEGALKLASKLGYSQLFQLEGIALIPLLQGYLKLPGKKRDKAAEAYARKLLKSLPDYEARSDLPEELAAYLSRQEVRVCQMLAAGQKNKKIAECLGISPETVKKHNQSIYKKLGVKNRLEIGKLMVDRSG